MTCRQHRKPEEAKRQSSVQAGQQTARTRTGTAGRSAERGSSGSQDNATEWAAAIARRGTGDQSLHPGRPAPTRTQEGPPHAREAPASPGAPRPLHPLGIVAHAAFRTTGWVAHKRRREPAEAALLHAGQGKSRLHSALKPALSSSSGQAPFVCDSSHRWLLPS